MSLLIGFLTFLLVMNCLFLILLILIQLPKKEAGAGIAFGGAATDALFGAGSGNALTNLTKYSASFFVLMAVVLSMLNMHAARAGSRRLEQELSRQASIPASPAVPSTTPKVQVTPVPPTNNSVTLSNALVTTNAVTLSTAPATTVTNPVSKPTDAAPAAK